MRRPIGEDDLHAWADDRLPPERRAEVDAWLAEDPSRAARVQAWRDDAERLRRTYDDVLDEPVPARFRRFGEVHRRPRLQRVAAVVAWIAIGTLIGGGAGYRFGQSGPPSSLTGPLASLPRDAAVAHAVFSPEVRHPVEVSAANEQHLLTWLTKRLGAPVRVPDLSSHGFALLGGRLLPATGGPGAQFMYEDDGGRRLTLYLTVRDGDETATAFRFAAENGIGVFYWVDGRFAYALSGEFGRDTLLPLANAAYHQVTR